MPITDTFSILGVSHLGLAVERIEEFTEGWGRALGLDNWLIRENVVGEDTQFDGSMKSYAVRLGYSRLGDLGVELVETLSGETCHSRSISRFGAGLHHIAFWVEDLPTEVARARRLGLQLAMAPSGLVATVDRMVAAPPAVYAAGVRPEADIADGLYAFFCRQDQLNFTLELLDVKFIDQYQALTGHRLPVPSNLTEGRR